MTARNELEQRQLALVEQLYTLAHDALKDSLGKQPPEVVEEYAKRLSAADIDRKMVEIAAALISPYIWFSARKDKVKYLELVDVFYGALMSFDLIYRNRDGRSSL